MIWHRLVCKHCKFISRLAPLKFTVHLNVYTVWHRQEALSTKKGKVFTFIVAVDAQHLSLPFYFVKARGHSATNACPHSNNPLSHKAHLFSFSPSWSQKGRLTSEPMCLNGKKAALILLGAPIPAKRRRVPAQRVLSAPALSVSLSHWNCTDWLLPLLYMHCLILPEANGNLMSCLRIWAR